MERNAALKAGDFMDFWRNDDPKCPHCGGVVNIAENELWNLYEDGEHDIECDECGREFRVTTNVSYTFCTDEQPDDEEQLMLDAPMSGGV